MKESYFLMSHNNLQITKDTIKKNQPLRALGWFFLLSVIIAVNQLFSGQVFLFYGQSDENIHWFWRSFLGVELFLNDRFAFSLPVPLFLIYPIYNFLFVLLFFYIFRRWKTFSGRERLAWFLIVAGGLSNVFERIFTGYVRDFLYIFGGAILNLADLEIFLGLLLLVWRGEKKDVEINGNS